MAVSTSNDYYFFKLYIILQGPGRTVLRQILKYGTNKPDSITLFEYLDCLPYTSTANYRCLSNREKRSMFTRTEKEQLHADPSCDNSDITLLFKIITVACENVASINDNAWKNRNCMEGLVNEIKKERNSLVHEFPSLTAQDFHCKVRELKTLFCRTLEFAQRRYSIPDEKNINMKDDILKDMSDIIDIKAFEEPHIGFIEETRRALKEIYKQDQYFDPFNFLSGSPMNRVHIESLFCNVILKEKNTCTEIDYSDLLKLKESSRGTISESSQLPQNRQPELIIISGVAGSGKTTLLTYIMSEWVKDESDRQIKNLEEYDIVLRVLCREKASISLKRFLEEIIPEVSTKFHDSMMKQLKDCKVLFLIDGIDELNSSSDQLVHDILNFGKYVPGFKIIATSRPEKVVDFLAQAGQTYQIQEVNMEGIVPSEKANCVLKYYSCLSDNLRNHDQLRSLLGSIDLRKHFGLPLNLLFLAKIFKDKPDCVTSSISQSRLYFTIHDCCVDKLQQRLAIGNVRETSRRERNICIRNVLKGIYEVAFHGLLQNTLNLSDKDLRKLRDCCKVENLPFDEVMGSFLYLRQYIRNHVIYEEYCLPSDGLQEYFFAQYVIEHLNDGFVPGIIRHLLPDSLEPLNSDKLRNAFLHVAWLLSKSHEASLYGAKNEAMDIIAETGVEGCDAWLSLLDDEIMEDVSEHIAHHVKQVPPDTTVRITDSTLYNSIVLLPLVPFQWIEVDVRHQPLDMDKFSRVMKGHKCTKLFLWHYYKHPLPGTPLSDSILQSVDTRYLLQFKGHLSADAMKFLPTSLRRLYLGVSSNEHARSLLPALTSNRQALPNLEYLFIHVPLEAIEPQVLTQPLPDAGSHRSGGVVLTLSGVKGSQVEKAWRIAAALQNRRGYFGIRFPDCKMDIKDWSQLIEHLAEAKVRTGDGKIVAPDISITEEGWKFLMGLANRKLECDFDTVPEDMLWKGLWPEEDD